MGIVPATRLELADGRTVSVLEAGAIAGAPVLVFHPTPSSCLFVRQHHDVARRLGVRLLGFSRPGSGGSTMTAPGLRVVAADAMRVAEAAGVDRLVVLGFSGGTPFAAATAALFPERVRAVGLCAAVAPLPLTESETLGAETRHYARLLALDDEGLIGALVAEASPEDAPYLDHEVATHQAATLRDAFPDSGAFDTLDFDYGSFTPPWDVDVSTVSAPTWVWQGTRDEVTPMAHAEWYVARIHAATLVPRPGLGHLGSFEAHVEEMLVTLRETSG